MTVAELRKALEGLHDEYPVWLYTQTDEEPADSVQVVEKPEGIRKDYWGHDVIVPALTYVLIS